MIDYIYIVSLRKVTMRSRYSTDSLHCRRAWIVQFYSPDGASTYPIKYMAMAPWTNISLPTIRRHPVRSIVSDVFRRHTHVTNIHQYYSPGGAKVQLCLMRGLFGHISLHRERLVAQFSRFCTARGRDQHTHTMLPVTSVAISRIYRRRASDATLKRKQSQT